MEALVTCLGERGFDELFSSIVMVVKQDQREVWVCISYPLRGYSMVIAYARL